MLRQIVLSTYLVLILAIVLTTISITYCIEIPGIKLVDELHPCGSSKKFKPAYVCEYENYTFFIMYDVDKEEFCMIYGKKNYEPPGCAYINFTSSDLDEWNCEYVESTSSIYVGVFKVDGEEYKLAILRPEDRDKLIIRFYRDFEGTISEFTIDFTSDVTGFTAYKSSTDTFWLFVTTVEETSIETIKQTYPYSITVIVPPETPTSYATTLKFKVLKMKLIPNFTIVDYPKKIIVQPGKQFTIWVKIKNVGNATGKAKIQLLDYDKNVVKEKEEVFEPGEEKKIEFTLTAPSKPAIYTYYIKVINVETGESKLANINLEVTTGIEINWQLIALALTMILIIVVITVLVIKWIRKR